MFYYSTKSSKKIIHLENCHHIKAIKKENLAEISSAASARRDYFRICKCCSPITKDYRKNQDEILDFALSNGIRCYISRGSMRVNTFREKWLILASGNDKKLELHHRSKYDNDNENSVLGFHKQKFSGNSIMDVLKYVSYHETYRMQNPLPKKKHKEPPKKGTKRWNTVQKREKKKEKKQQIRNVLNLIDSLAI